ncbi:MAG: hypothetical protein H8E64_02135 [Candidatus Marinimicrobia bacterium]|nr:hypothetical protein [Candidatus Neomarinimicrobiota bacterium]
MVKNSIIIFFYFLTSVVFSQQLYSEKSLLVFQSGLTQGIQISNNDRMVDKAEIEISINAFQSSNTPLRMNDNRDENTAYWLNFGLGISYFGPLINSSISYKFGKNLFTLRYIKADELRFSPGGYEFEEPPLSLREIGLLYGRDIGKEKIVVNIGGGIGFFNAIDRGEKIDEIKFEKVKISLLSIPIKAAVKFDITKYFGIGISMISNLNNQKNLYSGVIEIYIGKM